MATSSEVIKRNIEHTRDNVSNTVEEISNRLHKKVDIQQKVKENPYGALGTALAAGFVVATFSTPIGKSLFRIAIKSATAALGAYASKKGMSYVMNRIKIQ